MAASSSDAPAQPALQRIDTDDVIAHIQSRQQQQTSARASTSNSGWASGLCGCCGAQMVDKSWICCIAYTACAPCLFGTALEAAGLSKSVVGFRTLHLRTLSCDVSSCCACAVCPCLVQYRTRRLAASKYSIAESQTRAVASACCCTCCSFAQVVNQILCAEGKIFSDLYGSFKLVDTKPARPVMVVQDPVFDPTALRAG